LVATSGGELLVPNATSYEVAPDDAAHAIAVDVGTSIAPLVGDGTAGTAGGAGGGAAAVVNDHNGPAVDPPGPLAVIRQ
jgi:hypothetical protein